MKELDYKILRYVGSLSREINSISDIKYKEFNLQKGQYLFITRICENPGINLIDLSNLLKVDKTTTTKAIKKLIEIGYINKEQDKNYRRGYKLTPTEKALKIYDKIMEEEFKQLGISFQGFSEEEKKLATDLIEKMSKNIEDYWMEVKSK